MIILCLSNNKMTLTHKDNGKSKIISYNPKFKSLKHNSSQAEIQKIVENEYQILSKKYNLVGTHGSVETYRNLAKYCYQLKNNLAIDYYLNKSN